MPRFPLRWEAFLIAAAAVLAFLPSLSGAFVYDDSLFIEHNPYIREVRPLAVWAEPFPNKAPGVGLYRPVTALAWSLEYAGWGLDPRGYHAVSLALHALACLLLWRILLRLWSPGPALICALLFAVHPIHTQAVAWISAQSELLAAVLGLGAVLAFLRGSAGWAVAAFALALGAKESAAAVPLYIALVAWFFPQRVDRRKLLLTLAGMALVGIAWFWARSEVLGTLGPSGVARALAHAVPEDRWHLPLQALARAVGNSLFPAGLALDPVFHEGGMSCAVWGAVLVSGIVLALAWAGLRRLRTAALETRAAPTVGFVALVFLAGWLPVSNWIVPIGELYADRFLYLGAVLGCGLLAGCAAGAGEKRDARPRALLAAALALVWVGACWSYGACWRSPRTLFDREVLHSPRGNRAQLGLAVARPLDPPDRIYRRFRRSMDSRPTPNALANLAAWTLQAGGADVARLMLARLEELAPRFAHRWFLESVIARGAGDAAGERAALERTLALQPDHIQAGLRRAELLWGQGDREGAEEQLDRVPELWLEDQSPARLKARWAARERPDLAERLLAELARRGDDGWRIYAEWGVACARQGKFKEAALRYEQALEQVPPDPDAGGIHFQIASCRLQQDPPAPALAREHAEHARKLGYAVPAEFDRLLGQ